MSGAGAIDLPEALGCAICGAAGMGWAAYLEHVAAHGMPGQEAPAAWQAMRRTFVGASEVPAVLGCNPWDSALDVWASKVLGVSKRKAHLENRETATLGHLMEPVLLADYARRHGVEVRPSPTLRHAAEPWCGATPDGVASSGELLQVKLVGARMLHHWQGPGGRGDWVVPQYVLVQVQWEMFVAGASRAVVIAGLGGTDREDLPVGRDEEIIEGARELVRLFWHSYVLPRVVPEIFDSPDDDTLRALYPRNLGRMERAPDEVVELAHRYAEAREAASNAEEVKERVAAQLKAAIGALDGYELPHGGRVTWKAAKASPSWKGIAEHLAEQLGLGPAALASLVEQHTAGHGSRRLHVAVK